MSQTISSRAFLFPFSEPMDDNVSVAENEAIDVENGIGEENVSETVNNRGNHGQVDNKSENQHFNSDEIESSDTPHGKN